MNIKARLFWRPKWELVRVTENGGRVERRHESGASCGKCGKSKAFMYRVSETKGGVIVGYVYFHGTWCSEDHMATGNRVDRITAGLKKSTGD